MFSLKQNASMEANDPEYIRYVTAWLPAGATLFGCILVLLGEAPDYKPEVENDDANRKLLDEFVE